MLSASSFLSPQLISHFYFFVRYFFISPDGQGGDLRWRRFDLVSVLSIFARIFRALFAFFPFSHWCVSVDEVELEDREPLDGDDVDGHNMRDEDDEEDGLYLRFCIRNRWLLFYSV